MEMDGQITGMEMHWHRWAAFTERGNVSLNTKSGDVSQVFLDVRCNKCGETTTIRIGESVPGGEVQMERMEMK